MGRCGAPNEGRVLNPDEGMDGGSGLLPSNLRDIATDLAHVGRVPGLSWWCGIFFSQRGRLGVETPSSPHARSSRAIGAPRCFRPRGKMFCEVALVMTPPGHHTDFRIGQYGTAAHLAAREAAECASLTPALPLPRGIEPRCRLALQVCMARVI